MCTVSISAQKLDSLLQVLGRYHKEDTVKLNLLNNIAGEYQNVNPAKGEETADSAIELAQKLHDSRGLAEALMMKAHNELKLNNKAGAENLYQKTLIMFQQLMNKKGMVVSLIGLGNVSINSGDYKRALDYYDKALNINEQLGDKKRTAAILLNKGLAYENLSDYTKALELLKKALDIYGQLTDTTGMSNTLINIGGVYGYLGDYETELSYYQKSLSISEKTGQRLLTASAFEHIGILYTKMRNNSTAMEYLKKALVIYRQTGERNIPGPLGTIGVIYGNQSKYNEAIPYFLESIKINEKFGSKNNIITNLNNLGFAYYKLSDYAKAWGCYQRGLSISEETGNKSKIALLHLSMGEMIRDAPDSMLSLIGINPPDRYIKALEHFNKGKQGAIEIGNLEYQRFAWEDLSIMYENQKDFPKAFEAYKNFISTRDSILNNEKEKKEIELGKKELTLTNQQKDIQNLAYLKTQADLQNEQLQKKEKEKQLTIAEKEKKLQQADAIKTKYNNRVRMYSLFAALGVFLLLAIILWRNNQNKQRANVLLSQQKNETDQQKIKAETALDVLKTTQNQLVQREKMASLGELTAGIAHEIQNPLNFVNNFSEVNTELIDEIEEEISKGNLEGIKLIAGDIRQNMEKINLHGKRADSIVKGMLQHSRSSSGTPELTDINALADEYLRLSYHGLRAKNKSFNATINTDFDKSIQKINIVQQDIGRVLLNLFNNAFYAVAEKSTSTGSTLTGSTSTVSQDYKPTVSVSTRKIGGRIEIKVRDNGMGIPAKIMDKIFQPFFTTKPTGEGTGLGLSLSYDIITKGIGGNINAETKEGEYAEFIVQLPA